ncbi:MAPEG family protein [Aestuariibius sp. 2305UL40-4]|uniref:MAPEG family protein n=1 Tax=Aestuariibius violaceus TaxID=3234132 RepID=UPI00345E73E3
MTLSTILALYGLLTAITLVLQATGAMQALGMGYLLSSRDEERTVAGMTGRLARALDNSVVAMALFAPAVILLIVLDREMNQTLLAAQIFLVARVIYVPAYIFGIIGLRTAVWTAGFIATCILYFLAL